MILEIKNKIKIKIGRDIIILNPMFYTLYNWLDLDQNSKSTSICTVARNCNIIAQKLDKEAALRE